MQIYIFYFILQVIAYCYINIIRAVSAQANEMRKQAEKMGAKAGKDERKRQQEIQLAKIAAVA